MLTLMSREIGYARSCKGVDRLAGAGGLPAELVAGEVRELQTLVVTGVVQIRSSSYWGVKPQPVAELTIRRTFPRQSDRGTEVPSMALTVKSQMPIMITSN